VHLALLNLALGLLQNPLPLLHHALGVTSCSSPSCVNSLLLLQLTLLVRRRFSSLLVIPAYATPLRAPRAGVVHHSHTARSSRAAVYVRRIVLYVALLSCVVLL
jgi:hypothetical protein